MATSSPALKSVDFEVFGTVQGVFFRKGTIQQAKKLGLVGWVKNTTQGTVVGVVQGKEDKLEIMKEWLGCVGSKRSTIKKCVFKNEVTLTILSYIAFEKRH